MLSLLNSWKEICRSGHFNETISIAPIPSSSWTQPSGVCTYGADGSYIHGDEHTCQPKSQIARCDFSCPLGFGNAELFAVDSYVRLSSKSSQGQRSSAVFMVLVCNTVQGVQIAALTFIMMVSVRSECPKVQRLIGS